MNGQRSGSGSWICLAGSDLALGRSVRLTSRIPAPEQMMAGDVDIWCLRMPRTEGCLFPESGAWLDRDETRRAGLFTDATARERYRTAHKFLRWVLAAYVGSPESSLCFWREPGGKPRLAKPNETAWQFSLSRTSEFVMVAVAREIIVGIDVESAHSLEPLPWSSLFGLEAAFDSAEVAAISALPLAEARLEALRLWTLKEALAKALGKGLALPLRSASFPVAGCAKSANEPKAPHKPWGFVSFALDRDHWFSAAIAGRTGRTRFLVVGESPTQAQGTSIRSVPLATCDDIRNPQLPIS